METLSFADVPDTEALVAWLAARELDTSDWGKGDTKTVKKLWKELEGEEAGLELWKTAEGKLQVVRTTHVLRARVTSAEKYARNIFLFNTWQQYGDGRKRTRNGLLSEKLTTSEMPFEENMHKICERAVCEEEMQRVEESIVKIVPGMVETVPTYDKSIGCPMKVEREHFVDHTTEIEVSKSYPGLITLYHLYTVDIVCSGLPTVDFNTLEFDHPDKDGNRALKYIHAWVWLEWSQIRRYLLEGSTLKERKTKGSFSDAASLGRYLSAYNLDVESWRSTGMSSVAHLYEELEKNTSNLELWGRHDGAPLLIRVVHAIQLKVRAADPRMADRFLMQMWQHTSKGEALTVNRLLAAKMSTDARGVHDAELKDEFFERTAREACEDELGYTVDAHVQLDPSNLPQREGQNRSGVHVVEVGLPEVRCDVEESPTFKGMFTMYHLYTVEVTCENLPAADFASLTFKYQGEVVAKGWRWVTEMESMDIFNARVQSAARKNDQRLHAVEKIKPSTDRLKELVAAMAKKVPDADSDKDVQEALSLSSSISANIDGLLRSYRDKDKGDVSKILPPSMLSKMSGQVLTSEKFLAEAERQHIERSQRRSTLPRRPTADSTLSSAS